MKIFGCAKGRMLMLLLVLGSGICVPAAAQEQLETVVIEGSSTCGTCVTNVSGSSPPDINMDVSRTSDADGGSGANLARKKKATAEEKEAARKRCEASYTRDLEMFTQESGARYNACANAATSGVAGIIDRITGQSAAQLCITEVAKWAKEKRFEIDLSRAQCLAVVDGM